MTASTDRRVYLWDLFEGSHGEIPEKIPLDLAKSSDGATCLNWSEDGKFLAIGKN